MESRILNKDSVTMGICSSQEKGKELASVILALIPALIPALITALLCPPPPMHQSHLEDYLKHIVEPRPVIQQVWFHLVICIANKSKVKLMLLCGPHFRNHTNLEIPLCLRLFNEDEISTQG